ncbi:hypothetical protein WICMUC_001955 [Wickerhamomyces mucosus]|uniref:Uncharacterized protein n=1 Tax=Wickerhamomyces mucosus TaxID=1378264 RepID=A0A9P8PTB1_9ASCO|nr:hypothetical protein WICMUC_001955 [Wickerhamomyces mucosus]
MLVQTPFKKSWECETKTKVRSNLFKYSSNQTQASKSKCAVGSSSNNKVGLTNKALAKATRIFQPPDISLVFLLIVTELKPKPIKITAALDSKVEGSIESILS